MAGRNKDKIDNAVDKIREDSGNPDVVSMILDVSSIKSVRRFAEEFKNTERRLDILINNAGMAGKYKKSLINWQITFFRKCICNLV